MPQGAMHGDLGPRPTPSSERRDVAAQSQAAEQSDKSQFEGSWHDVEDRLRRSGDPKLVAKADRVRQVLNSANNTLIKNSMAPINENHVYFEALEGDNVGESRSDKPLIFDVNLFMSDNTALDNLLLFHRIALHEQTHAAKKVDPEILVDAMVDEMGAIPNPDTANVAEQMRMLRQLGRHVKGAKNSLSGLKVFHAACKRNDRKTLSRTFQDAYLNWTHANAEKGTKKMMTPDINRQALASFKEIFGMSFQVAEVREGTRKKTREALLQ